jgi:hypothetical protein
MEELKAKVKTLDQKQLLQEKQWEQTSTLKSWVK